MTIVDVQDLTKVYSTGMRKGDIVALDSVSLSISEGEIFGLLGPNGAGKTTMLKVLLGITSITSGTATIDGFPPGNPRSRVKVGYLPENHRFPDHLTGLGLMELTGRLHGMSQKQMDERSDELLKLVGMERWASVKIRKFSKGMLQRIGLAQAMMPDPDVLFLDEPTDGVDPVGRTEIREVMKRIRSEGKSIVLNSHLLSEVESVADRVAILSRGRLIKVATVTELTSRASQYEVEADFGNKIIKLPEEVGKVVSMASRLMIVELTDPERINDVIDDIRMNKIKIKSVKPVTVTLEQSFMEAVSSHPEGAAQ
ncbi:MAG TPA: ABC transporter ATP-binding protein [candidate division Zixibacteria bacterium]|nr:ABC transporter ATP-binding protein [candidate division Zixibacteria bacterium]